jgi:hypothetical protein
MPFGKDRRWMNRGGLLNAVLGGWAINWVQTFESGPPQTVTFAGSPYRYLAMGSSRPNALVRIEDAVVKDWSIGPHRFPTSAQNPYLLFSSFAYPAAFTTGTLGRNVFEAPGLNWTQFSIFKRWRFGERAGLMLRYDMNNLPLKQPQYGGPNSSFNANSPSTFGRMTSCRGDWSNVGSCQPNMFVGLRAEF